MTGLEDGGDVLTRTYGKDHPGCRSPKGGGQMGEWICAQQLLSAIAQDGRRKLLFALCLQGPDLCNWHLHPSS